MAHPYRARFLRRRPRHRRALPAAAISRKLPAVMVERMLRLPAVDRLLGRALNHPRMLQWLGALAGLVLVALALRPLFVASASSAVAAGSVQASGSARTPVVTLGRDADEHTTSSQQSEILAVVAAYNQASITAAALGRIDVMAPYLASDGPTWAEVQVEYARRTARGETHEPTLTRWGVLRAEVTGASARVETQEQWDDITSVGGEVLSSQRGILTHNTYELRRATTSGRWQITTITTITVIG
jgi:hypothetical protein